MKTKYGPQKALDSTKRTQYVDKDVVKTIPERQEGTLEFFTLDKVVTDNELEKEYASRGLVPASPINICEYDMENREKMDQMKYVATHWQNDGWCYATFRRWDDEPKVLVDRYDSRWRDYWWFAGLRKSSALESEPSLDSQNLELRVQKLEKIVQALRDVLYDTD